jgi:hypothetical protein
VPCGQICVKLNTKTMVKRKCSCMSMPIDTGAGTKTIVDIPKKGHPGEYITMYRSGGRYDRGCLEGLNFRHLVWYYMKGPTDRYDP